MLFKYSEVARVNNFYVGGLSHTWVSWYTRNLTDNRSILNEWWVCIVKLFWICNISVPVIRSVCVCVCVRACVRACVRMCVCTRVRLLGIHCFLHLQRTLWCTINFIAVIYLFTQESYGGHWLASDWFTELLCFGKAVSDHCFCVTWSGFLRKVGFFGKVRININNIQIVLQDLQSHNSVFSWNLVNGVFCFLHTFEHSVSLLISFLMAICLFCTALRICKSD